MELIRPRLTDYHGIHKNQSDLDFAIQFFDEDIPLYIDPFLVWTSPSQQDNALHTTITNSFNHLNYLVKKKREDEAMYLDYAEHQAEKQIPMTMKDWSQKLNAFLEFNEHDILQNSGKVTAKIAKEFALSEFEKYKVIQDQSYQSDFDRLLGEMGTDD